jgi:hypothetical protein
MEMSCEEETYKGGATPDEETLTQSAMMHSLERHAFSPSWLIAHLCCCASREEKFRFIFVFSSPNLFHF